MNLKNLREYTQEWISWSKSPCYRAKKYEKIILYIYLPLNMMNRLIEKKLPSLLVGKLLSLTYPFG